MTSIVFTQELKDKWIAALRSGEYTQTEGVLQDNTGFCCLGVLCDIINPNGWCEPGYAHAGGERSHDLVNEIYAYPDENEEGVNPILTVDPSHLYRRNDGVIQFDDDKHDFNRIADWIEENVPVKIDYNL